MNNERIAEIKNYLKSKKWDNDMLRDQKNDILTELEDNVELPIFITETQKYHLIISCPYWLDWEEYFLELETNMCVYWDIQEISERLDYWCCLAEEINQTHNLWEGHFSY